MMTAHYDDYMAEYLEKTCREERQYALFLYNVFGKMRDGSFCDDASAEIAASCLYPKEMSKNSGLSETERLSKARELLGKTKIVEVIYEVTFMRDFFERERKCAEETAKESYRRTKKEPWGHIRKYRLEDLEKEELEFHKEYHFNKDIVDFCCLSVALDNEEAGKRVRDELVKEVPLYKNLHDQRNLPYGKEKYKNLEPLKKSVLGKAQAMMNAKPDLAVIYTYENGAKQMVFFECKYLSAEGKGQIGIQQDILHFLCGGRETEMCGKNGEYTERLKSWKGILKQYRNAGVYLIQFQRDELNVENSVLIETYASKTSDATIWQVKIGRQILLEAAGR